MLQCTLHDALPGCPWLAVPLSFLRCYLSRKWVRSSEGGAISLEQRAQIPTLCFWNPVAPRSRGTVWSPLYQAGWSRQPQGFTHLLPSSRAGTRQVTKPE